MSKKNFTITTVATAPSPATSGTSLVVATGTGSLFALNEPAIIFPTNNQPLVSNAEIVMVTNISSDTLTITRTQEGTSAREIVEGDIIIQGITAKDWNDLVASKFTWKGAWATSTGYLVNDTVENDGSGYVCTVAHTSGASTEPGVGASWADKWELFVEGTDKTMPTGDIVGTTDTQTLTNKTLTAPALTSPTMSGTWDGWISAGETWTYASADDPTYTFTVGADVTTKYSVGMKIKLTQTTAKYFIITKVAYSSPNTTITVYGGTDYDLANATITSPYYSTQKAPYGFPMSPLKWRITQTFSGGNQGSLVSGTWYNISSNLITIPIGVWNIYYKIDIAATGTGGFLVVYSTLSNANNTKWDDDLTCLINTSSGITQLGYMTESASKTLSMDAKTNLYLNLMSNSANTTAIYITSPSICTATCAYL